MPDRATTAAPPAAPRVDGPDLRMEVHKDAVGAGNALADIVDFLHVVEVLTTHPEWAEHEAALATVLRHTATMAVEARDAARRAADGVLDMREVARG